MLGPAEVCRPTVKLNINNNVFTSYNAFMEFYLGTWQVAQSDGFWTSQDLAESENVISTAVKNGICSFDTAQSYGKGQAEQTLAKVLRRFLGVSCRPCTLDFLNSCALEFLNSCRIDTKIMPSSKNVEDVLRPSIERLKPFPIDCLYLHWPRSGFDNLGYVAEMLKLKDKGLVGKVGVCNLPLEMLQAFIKQGLQVDRIQIPISLLWTRDLDSTLQFCRENRISVSSYSPTGMGLLSGKYRKPEDLHDARANLFCFQGNCQKQFLDLLGILSEIAEKHGVSCSKVALSWVVSKDPDIIVIGARTKTQLVENLSGNVSLSDAELSDLNLAAQKLDKASQEVCTNIFSYEW